MSARRSKKVYVPAPVILPDEPNLEAVKQLPAPQPGVLINVPLMLWPAYMQLHGIKPTEYRLPQHVLLIQKIQKEST